MSCCEAEVAQARGAANNLTGNGLDTHTDSPSFELLETQGDRAAFELEFNQVSTSMHVQMHHLSKWA